MAYELSLLTLIGINIILALSLNFISGFCGQISLGHAAFYGIGAYVAALTAKIGVPIWLVIPVAATAAGIAGFLVGIAAARVQEDFLAIATMAVGFIFVGVVKSSETLGGEMGLVGVPPPETGPVGFVVLVWVLTASTTTLCLYVTKSWLGFAFRAVADDEFAARAIGIDDRNFKIVAFTIGTAIAGMAGALFTYYLRSVGPDAFGFFTSAAILLMVVLGGMGSVLGSALGAVLLTLMPEALRFAENYKLLIFGALLFLIMRFLPGGMASVPKILLGRSNR